jgi:hypothetical protein
MMDEKQSRAEGAALYIHTGSYVMIEDDRSPTTL